MAQIHALQLGPQRLRRRKASGTPGGDGDIKKRENRRRAIDAEMSSSIVPKQVSSFSP
jgi:hypothetical protein